MMWYHELCIYAACGVLTASAMRVWCEDGELGNGETLAVGIFWPFFALLLVAVLIIKMFNKKGGKNEN